MDGDNGQGVIGALIELAQTATYAISDEHGRFEIEVPNDAPAMLVVSALGYGKRYEAVDDPGETVRVSLDPAPIELEGLGVSVVTYKTRLTRRRNAALARSYALEGALLTRSLAANVWDLVGKKHGFGFEGYSDYGCPRARILGEYRTVGLYVNDRPIPLHLFQDYAPRDFALVEVFGYGHSMWAYTQEYLDWMTERGSVARPYETNPGLCPAQKETGLKRGRPIGPHN